MEIQTLSVVVGNMACPSNCGFCVAKMTYKGEFVSAQDMNLPRFHKAVKLALNCGATNLLITGKGEPTLWPKEISTVLEEASPHLPIVELQTNGIYLNPDRLVLWRKKGLDTIALSVVSNKWKTNRDTYWHESGVNYLSLEFLSKMIHNAGLSMRVCGMLNRQGLGSWREVEDLINQCREFGIEQCTIRDIVAPYNADRGSPQYQWVQENKIDDRESNLIHEIIERTGTAVLKLSYGATVYDYYGQNVCISNCLTIDQEPDKIRSLIYTMDGHIRHHWAYPGAILV